MSNGGGQRRGRRTRTAGASEPASRWWSKYVVVPIVTAVIGAGGAVIGVHEEHAHDCQRKTSVTTVVDQGPGGKVLDSKTTRQSVSCD
jgi:hypothetical protein